MNFFLKTSSKLVRGIYSLDSPIKNEFETTWIDLLSDESSQNLEHILALKKIKENINEIFTPLSSREESILRLRFGINNNISYTLKEIGEMYGLTRERVRQIQNIAQNKIAMNKKYEYFKDLL